MVQFDGDGNPDPDTIIPLIDGGTEGFKGQARVIFPMVTTCFECALDAFPPQVNFPLCTIAETPRLPEHCIEWASVLQWPENFPEEKMDGDNPEHLKWCFEKAAARAAEYGIEGVTYQLTMGVVKRIIPAVASTNAVIAAACASEALKVATYCAKAMGDEKNYMQFNGTDGLYVYSFEYERKEDCLVCSQKPQPFSIGASDTVGEVLEKITADPRLQLKHPSVRAGDKTVYMRQPASVEVATRPNLEKPASEFFGQGSTLAVTDPTLPHPPYVMLSINVVSLTASSPDQTFHSRRADPNARWCRRGERRWPYAWNARGPFELCHTKGMVSHEITPRPLARPLLPPPAPAPAPRPA